MGMDRIGQNIMLAKLLYLVIALLNQAIIVSEFEKQITIVSISNYNSPNSYSLFLQFIIEKS